MWWLYVIFIDDQCKPCKAAPAGFFIPHRFLCFILIALGMWESSGWISDADPYGWFQWYCRFYQGRRSSDDARQIARWKGVAGKKGRFRSQICNKIIAANTRANDESISPVIRQTLFHWGLEVTDKVLELHKNRE